MCCVYLPYVDRWWQYHSDSSLDRSWQKPWASSVLAAACQLVLDVPCSETWIAGDRHFASGSMRPELEERCFQQLVSVFGGRSYSASGSGLSRRARTPTWWDLMPARTMEFGDEEMLTSVAGYHPNGVCKPDNAGQRLGVGWWCVRPRKAGSWSACGRANSQPVNLIRSFYSLRANFSSSHVRALRLPSLSQTFSSDIMSAV